MKNLIILPLLLAYASALFAQDYRAIEDQNEINRILEMDAHYSIMIQCNSDRDEVCFFEFQEDMASLDCNCEGSYLFIEVKGDKNLALKELDLKQLFEPARFVFHQYGNQIISVHNFRVEERLYAHFKYLENEEYGFKEVILILE